MMKSLSLGSALLLALVVSACKSEVRRDSDRTTTTSGQTTTTSGEIPAAQPTLNPPAPAATDNVDRAPTAAENVDRAPAPVETAAEPAYVDLDNEAPPSLTRDGG